MVTLKAKKKKSYKPFIQVFLREKNKSNIVKFEMNASIYECVKLVKDNETNYIFFSEKLYNESRYKKEKRNIKSFSRKMRKTLKE